MQKLRIMSVVGARPNLMKIAPFVRELDKHADRFDQCLVDTGQHYDHAMSDSFFSELGIPKPDVNLEVGSGTHAEQIGRTMMAFEPVLKKQKPDWVVVVGDVNATCACSLTAKKENVKVAHIEAGLRSFDNTMPEEINRMVTDRLSDLLLTPDEDADRNLLKEGMSPGSINRVGNIMIDTLEENRTAATKLNPMQIVSRNLMKGGPHRDPSVIKDGYALLTMHRPSNVDAKAVLETLVKLFVGELSKEMPLVWTIHPRTRKQLELYELTKIIEECPGIFLMEPLGYRPMLRLNMGAKVMLTDSGGLQEECCVLGTPCIVLRGNTERPVTLAGNGGVCELAGHDAAKIRELFGTMKNAPKREFRPPLWDGHTAERIVDAFLKLEKDKA